MTTVAGLFETQNQVREAVNALEKAGFSRDNFGIVGKEESIDRSETTEYQQFDDKVSDIEGVATIGGMVVGSYIGLLLGLSAVTVTGLGAVMAAGVPTLSAAAVGGAAVGGAAGAGVVLTQLGFDEDEAEAYAEGIKEGHILLTVSATEEEEINQARKLIDDAGAVDVNQYKKEVSNVA